MTAEIPAEDDAAASAVSDTHTMHATDEVDEIEEDSLKQTDVQLDSTSTAGNKFRIVKENTELMRYIQNNETLAHL